MFLYLLVLYISVCDAEVVLLQQIEVLTYFVKEHLTLGSLLCGKKYTFKKKDTMEIIHISNKKKNIIKESIIFKGLFPPKNLIRVLSCMRKGFYFVVVFQYFKCFCCFC